MDRFEFYRALNSEEDDRKNEINSSLSLPIGIISGFVAALFYFLTNFEFSLNLIDTVCFWVTIVSSIVFLFIAGYHLIKAYANFDKGYGYDHLADAGDLEKYYQELKNYYQTYPELSDASDEKFKQHIFTELVKNTGTNQKNNKTKSFHRYKCQTHLIYTLACLCLTLLPFTYNFAVKKEKKQNVTVDFKSPTEIKITKENINLIDSLILKFKTMTPEEKPVMPIPPPSQTIKEGQDPNIRPQTTQNPSTTQTSGGKGK